MIRLYVNVPLQEDQSVLLSDLQNHYLQKVMRVKAGQSILLFNGREGEWKAEVVELSKKETHVKVLCQTRLQTSGKDVWLLFSPLKPKRQEFLIEKATELGVSCFWPVLFERTSIPRINIDKMKAHAIEATEQSQRLTVPEIKPLTPLSKVLTHWPLERMLIYGDERLTSPPLQKLDIQGTCAFIVGPEGGFTDQEFFTLKEHGQGVTLNSNILRAETAALVGLSFLQLMPFSDKSS